MKKKLVKLTAILCIVALSVVGLAACGNQSNNSQPAGSAAAQPQEAYVVGICQLVQHPALDAATKGFRDALTAELGEGNVVFDEQNASGDSPTCATICNGFAAEHVDLIMANATGALQAAASATADIPILGTSVSAYSAALNLGDDFDGVVGTNISGTSDLAPLDQQAAMVKELFPNAKTVGILYCSGEANSVYQAKEAEKYLTELGFEVKTYTFADSNDIALVTQEACDSSDVLYIPTDNVAASCTSTIDPIAREKKTPIIAGEEGICSGCGVATLSIDYYGLGEITGKMAAEVLTGKSDISKMAVQYYPDTVKKYNKDLAEFYGLTMPADYVAIETEE